MIRRIRPYSVEYTRSRSISEVKQPQAGLVLGWVTAWESPVPYPFKFFSRVLSYYLVMVFRILGSFTLLSAFVANKSPLSENFSFWWNIIDWNWWCYNHDDGRSFLTLQCQIDGFWHFPPQDVYYETRPPEQIIVVFRICLAIYHRHIWKSW